MRKITKSLLTLALLVLAVGGANATKLYATYGSPAGEGSWNAGTNTYSWTKNYSNLMPIFTFSNGELANYTSIKFSTTSYTDVYRLYFHGPNKEIAFYSAGDKTIVFAERAEFDGVDLSTVTGISFGGASESGSIQITKTPYLEKPTVFSFDETGKAYLYPSDLTATGYGLDSFDEETGTVVKSTTGYGGIYFDFGVEGYDFSNITNIEINIDGGFDDIRDYANVDDLNGHTQYISATGGPFTLDKTTIDSNIKKWNLGLNSKTGSMKINYICFTSNVLNACLGEEVPMSALTNYHWNGSAWGTAGYTPAYRINETTGTAYFGIDYSGENCQNYSDVTGYKAIRIYSAQGNVPRAMFFKSDASGQQQFDFTWNDEEKCYELLLSTVYASVSNYKLISVRPQIYTSSSIKGIYMVIDDPIYSYRISGSGLATSKLTAALSDATATSYDATGVTGSGVDFTSVANPNALFVAGSGVLANTKNVIASGTCANLVLTDGNPFKAPIDFTATAASYSTTINAGAGAGTLCLPFAATIPGGVTAYTLTYAGGEKATATPVETTISANTPVLLNGSGAAEFTGSDAAVSASATNTYGALTGVFAATTVPVDSYVLQKQSEKVGFFKVTGAKTINPFRAYLTAPTPAPGLSIIFPEDNDVTGISEIEKMRNADNVTIFDLQGRKVAQPQKGLYIVNGKKVIFK